MKVYDFKAEEPGPFSWKLRVYNRAEIKDEETWRNIPVTSLEAEDERDRKTDAAPAGEVGEDDRDNLSGEEDVRPRVADMLLYGEIGGWNPQASVSPKLFADALAKAGPLDVLNVRIHSVGGNVFDAIAIHSMLQASEAEVTAYVDGMAASAASVIAMGADSVIMRRGTWMMIHNTMSMAFGDAETMRKEAETLDKVRDGIAALYQAKTKLPLDRIQKMMDEETWLSAKQAVKLGFADEIRGRSKVKVKDGQAKNALINGVVYNLAHFRNVPEIKGTPDKPEVRIAKPEKVSAKVMDLEQLKKDHPELFNQIQADARKSGVEAERVRLADLKDLEHPATMEIVNKAREGTATAAEITMACFKAIAAYKPPVEKAAPTPATPNTDLQNARAADAAVIGKIGPDGKPTKDDELKSHFVNSLANEMARIRGVKLIDNPRL